MSFIIGALISFLGSINPGILTLTTLKIGIEQGRKPGYLFALGVGFVIALQAYFSLEFASYIKDNPLIERNIQIIGCVVFFILSIYFFYLGKGNPKEEEAKDIRYPFWGGAILAFLNVFSVVFYAGAGLGLNYGGWLEFKTDEMLYFSIGSALGSLGFLLIVVEAAEWIDKKIALLSNNINYILGGVTGGIAVMTLYSLV